MSDELATLLVAGALLWALYSLCLHVFPRATRALGNILRGTLQFALIRPSRERGILFGLWHLLLVVGIAATVMFLCVPSQDTATLAVVLWLLILGGKGLAHPLRKWKRRQVPLPGRRRSRRSRKRPR